MAHSNVNAIIDPQLQQFHGHQGAQSRHGSVHYPQHHGLGDPRQQHGGYQLQPQLGSALDPQDDDADDGESAGEDGSHASPDDTGNAG